MSRSLHTAAELANAGESQAEDSQSAFDKLYDHEAWARGLHSSPIPAAVAAAYSNRPDIDRRILQGSTPSGSPTLKTGSNSRGPAAAPAALKRLSHSFTSVGAQHKPGGKTITSIDLLSDDDYDDDKDDDSRGDFLGASPTLVFGSNHTGKKKLVSFGSRKQELRTKSYRPTNSLRKPTWKNTTVTAKLKSLADKNAASRLKKADAFPNFSLPKNPIDQKRAHFTARAVLNEAFSDQAHQEDEKDIQWGVAKSAFKVMTDAAIKYAQAGKTKPFKLFPKSAAPFEKTQIMPDKRDYHNTATVGFDACVWPASSPGERRYMQSIAFQSTYENFSFEELRVGDYLWDRTIAPHRFTLFPNLPPEIRAMIWEFCCNFPRTIELRYGYPSGKPSSPSPPPVMLHVSQESRKFALKNYELAFHNCPIHPSQVYFNFAADTLALTWLTEESDEYEGEVEELVASFPENDLRRVQFLAIDEGLFGLFMMIWDDEVGMFQAGAQGKAPDFNVVSDFRWLKTLAIVSVEGTEEHYWGIRPCPCEGACDSFWEGCPKVDMTFSEVSARSVHLAGADSKYRRTLREIKQYHKDWQLPMLKYIKKVCVERKK